MESVLPIFIKPAVPLTFSYVTSTNTLVLRCLYSYTYQYNQFIFGK